MIIRGGQSIGYSILQLCIGISKHIDNNSLRFLDSVKTKQLRIANQIEIFLLVGELGGYL